MGYIVESLRQIFGARPTKPEPHQVKVAVKDIYARKRQTKVTRQHLEVLHEAHEGRNRWRIRRWITLVVVNLLFVVSYRFDVQLVEGALTASRVVGFHFADLNSALQVMLAYKHVVLNLVIGTSTVLVLWWLLGGRTFCSWVCPYHLLAEWVEPIHLWLAKKRFIRNHSFHRGVRGVFWVLFAVLALVTGYTVFETISPTGILSRALIYGPGVALGWVALLLLFEIFVSRRAWCRYVCPIGLTYAIVGVFSPLRVQYDVHECKHEGDCRAVCMVPHVLDITIRGRAIDEQTDITADCTRCGRCVEVCPTHSLTFKVKGLDRLL